MIFNGRKKTQSQLKKQFNVSLISRVQCRNYGSTRKSLNHILAEDIATYDIPRFDKSPYDGFAIRSVDSQGQVVRIALSLK